MIVLRLDVTVPISGGATELVGPIPCAAADCSPSPSGVTPGLGRVVVVFHPSDSKTRQRERWDS